MQNGTGSVDQELVKGNEGDAADHDYRHPYGNPNDPRVEANTQWTEIVTKTPKPVDKSAGR